MTNLTTNEEYKIQIQGGTHSLYVEGLMHLGELSEIHKIRVGKMCDFIQVRLDTSAIFS